MTGCSWSRPGSARSTTSLSTTRSAPSMWRRPLPTAPITSWSAGRSARLPIRARRPARSRRRLRLFSLPNEELLEQPLEMRMDRQLRAVKQQLAPARHADRGEVLHLEVAHFVGLVLDIDPAEPRLRKFLREREEAWPIVDAGVTPFRAQAAHHDHG